MTHDELLAALEAATGPDRELDVKIALALGWEEMRYFPPSEWPLPRYTQFPGYRASAIAALKARIQ